MCGSYIILLNYARIIIKYLIKTLKVLKIFFLMHLKTGVEILNLTLMSRFKFKLNVKNVEYISHKKINRLKNTCYFFPTKSHNDNIMLSLHVI